MREAPVGLIGEVLRHGWGRRLRVVTLRPVNLKWINGAADDPKDLCAHGEAEFRIGPDVLLDSAAVQEMTVSAAALYLLRTLSAPHTKASPVGDHLFPCCGSTMYDFPDEQDVVICGCPNGDDFEVTHEGDGSGVVVRSEDGREWHLGWPVWRAAVFGFADRVSEFYRSCSPKEPFDAEDTRGLRKFANEWERRRGERLGLKIR